MSREVVEQAKRDAGRAEGSRTIPSDVAETILRDALLKTEKERDAGLAVNHALSRQVARDTEKIEALSSLIDALLEAVGGCDVDRELLSRAQHAVAEWKLRIG